MKYVVGCCLVLAACSFTPRAGQGSSDGPIGSGDAPIGSGDAPPSSDARLVDASPDAPPDAPPDAQSCFGNGLLGALCLASAPSTPALVPSGTLDTGNDASCTQVISVAGIELGVIAGSTVGMAGDTTVIGTRPLVLLAASTLTIDHTLDLSSKRGGPTGAAADSAICGQPGNASGTGGNDNGGAAGGGGGSFQQRGGAGGTGDTNGSPTAGASSGQAQPASSLRGGCPGGAGGNGAGHAGGAGGASGGAVYLLAGQQISITGAVFASGAGGGGGNNSETGGGAGGSGGLIGLEAPAIAVTGIIAANGGGGGGGGGANGSGGAGGDGTTTQLDQRASGGSTGDDFGGQGASGSTGAQAGGVGGGGAGVGYVWVHGTVTTASPRISPPISAS